MEEGGLVCPHRILKPAKGGKAILDELVKCLFCLFGGDRPDKLFEIARVVGESKVYQFDDFLSYGIGRATTGLGRLRGALLAETFAVFLVKIPPSTNRVFPIHQYIVLSAHLTVEKFHPQRFSSPGMIFKFRL